MQRFRDLQIHLKVVSEAEIAALKQTIFESEMDAMKFPTIAEFSNLQDDNEALKERVQELEESKDNAIRDLRAQYDSVCELFHREHYEREAENTRLDCEWKKTHDWNNQLVSEHYEIKAENTRLREALEKIAAYGKYSGICPYGCDTPQIAREALKEAENDKKNKELVELLGLCYHVWINIYDEVGFNNGYMWKCIHCERIMNHNENVYPDFTMDDGKIPLLRLVDDFQHRIPVHPDDSFIVSISPTGGYDGIPWELMIDNTGKLRDAVLKWLRR